MDSQISPPSTDDEQERARDCQRAMEVAFSKLLSDAAVAGWQETEIAIVLADIADDHVLKLATKAKRKKSN